MKKRKILFLLAAMLCSALLLISCGGGDGDFSEYFKPNPQDGISYTELVKIDGEVVDFDEYEGIAAIRKTDVDALGIATETFKVIDVRTENVLYEGTFYYNPANTAFAENEISVNYFPLIRISHTSLVSTGSGTHTETRYDYYLPEVDKSDEAIGTHIVSDVSDETPDFNSGINLCTICLGGNYYFLNDKYEKIDVDYSVASAAFNFNDMDLAYYRGGYFWAFGENAITVYDKSLRPTASYSLTASDGDDDSFAAPAMLADGNLLVQEFIATENDDYDVVFSFDKDQRFYMNSYIINYKSGKSTEISLNYAILEVGPASFLREYSDFFYTPTEKVDNVAFIAPIKDRKVDTENEWLVAAIDNDANIIASTSISDMFSDGFMGQFVTDNRLIAETENGYCLYDENLSFVRYICDKEALEEVVNGHFLIGKKLYDINMNLVYDFALDGRFYDYELRSEDMLILYGESLAAPGALSPGSSECVYVFDFEKKEPVLLADGLSKQLYNAHLPYGLYGIVERPTAYDAPVLKMYSVASGELLCECLADSFELPYGGATSRVGATIAIVNGSYYILK